MCGILGIFNIVRRQPLEENRFLAALSLLDHRGPDARRYIRSGDDALLGHTRLSIIDRGEQSNQPMALRGRYWLVYNGEIFNYLELRKELEALGATFVTSGDAEVLMQAYAFWGEDCVARFNGMWAFAIYDVRENSLFCSRDRFGEKPFNYTIVNGQLIFASEIKAILAYKPDMARPELNAISNFCRTSAGAQHAQTWFKDILRLPPGHNLTIRDGTPRIVRYWRYPSSVNHRISFDEAREEYASLFQDAVRLRMRSDVPLGLTLSSGIDSTSIAYAMHTIDATPHNCFTSRFDPQEGLERDRSIYASGGSIDEAIVAGQVAQELDFDSHVVDTDYSDLVSSLSRIIYHLESGNSSPAVIPLMQLLGNARRHVTVLLEGQGADELLGGYVANILWPAIGELVAAGKLKDAEQSLREFSQTYHFGYSVKMALRDASSDFSVLSRLQQRLRGVDKIFGPVGRDYAPIKDYPDLPDDRGTTGLSQRLMRQHSGGLVNLLHYGDALSMANGLESRLPFLDYRLVEFVWPLPSHFKVNLGVGKYLHRRALRNLVPDRILDQKLKFGFNTPIGNQFRKIVSGVEDPVEVLFSSQCIDRGFFDKAGLMAIVNSHRSGRCDHGPLLFRMLSVELWFRAFIDTPHLQAELPGSGPDTTCLSLH